MGRKYTILMANDDGVWSPLLRDFAKSLRQDGHRVIIAAPDRDRSAISHSITLYNPLRIHEVETDCYAISGTPVDCVYVGLLHLVDEKPDLVVSGINNGYNLGADVFYSGTVAAAMEGGFRNVPAMAFSLDPDTRKTYGEEGIARSIGYATQLVKAALGGQLHPGTTWNINIPGACDGRFRFTWVGKRRYRDLVEKREDPRGRSYYWIGCGVEAIKNAPGADGHAVEEGVISITPLGRNLTVHSLVENAPQWTGEGISLV